MKKIIKLLFWENYNKIQIIQTFILISILFVWVYVFWLYLNLIKIATVFISVVVFDVLLSYIFTWNKDSWLNLSKVNMAFGILFFLRTDILWIYILVSFVTVLSKYLFLYKWKHFFNPSNFWVAFALLLFPPYAYTNPLQWTFDISSSTYWLVFFIVCIVWFLFLEYMLYKYLKMTQIFLILSFVITHILLFFSIWTHEGIDSALSLFSISFLIFAFFMITDPKTTPKYDINKIFFWISVAIWYYILSYFTNENFNLIWSLFIVILFLPLIWSFEEKYKNYKKYIWWFFVFFLSSFILIWLFLYYWHLDLQFANRCISIICK